MNKSKTFFGALVVAVLGALSALRNPEKEPSVPVPVVKTQPEKTSLAEVSREKLKTQIELSLLWLESLRNISGSLLVEMPNAGNEKSAPYFLQRYLDYSYARLQVIAKEKTWKTALWRECMVDLSVRNTELMNWEKQIEAHREYFEKTSPDADELLQPQLLTSEQPKQIMQQAWVCYSRYLAPIVKKLRGVNLK